MRRPDPAPPTPRSAAAALVLALAATVTLSLAATATLAQPAIERGRALYETRCTACHDRSVHLRDSRKARDFEALRREVERWSANTGGDWRAEEIDAVSVFLNDRYYRYPCPPSVCREPARAGAPRDGG